MIYQTNPKLIPAIQHYGCGILSSLFLFGYDCTSAEVNAIYDRLIAAKAIDADCTITWLPFTKALTEKYVWKAIVGPAYETHEDEIEILQFYDDNTGVKHFCGGDGHGKVAYDPWDAAGSKTAKDGRIIGKRIFKII